MFYFLKSFLNLVCVFMFQIFSGFCPPSSEPGCKKVHYCLCYRVQARKLSFCSNLKEWLPLVNDIAVHSGVPQLQEEPLAHVHVHCSSDEDGQKPPNLAIIRRNRLDKETKKSTSGHNIGNRIFR